MKKKVCMILGTIMLGISLLNSPAINSLSENNVAVVKAASYKNPTVRGDYGEIVVSYYGGHKLTSVKIDGKSKSLNVPTYAIIHVDENGNVTDLRRDEKHFKASKGRHKVEARDNHGYWVVDYVTVR